METRTGPDQRLELPGQERQLRRQYWLHLHLCRFISTAAHGYWEAAHGLASTVILPWPPEKSFCCWNLKVFRCQILYLIFHFWDVFETWFALGCISPSSQSSLLYSMYIHIYIYITSRSLIRIIVSNNDIFIQFLLKWFNINSL